MGYKSILELRDEARKLNIDRPESYEREELEEAIELKKAGIIFVKNTENAD